MSRWNRGNLDALGKAYECYRQGNGHVKAKQWEQAIGVYSEAIALDPKYARTHNDLAWLLATCPETKLRDPPRAPRTGPHQRPADTAGRKRRNTLGVAQYRTGDWKAAIGTLVKSNDLLGGKELSFNAFFLAMSHWQLGNREEAFTWRDQATQWMDKNKPQDEELRRFRTEAAALMEVEEFD